MDMSRDNRIWGKLTNEQFFSRSLNSNKNWEKTDLKTTREILMDPDIYKVGHIKSHRPIHPNMIITHLGNLKAFKTGINLKNS